MTLFPNASKLFLRFYFIRIFPLLRIVIQYSTLKLTFQTQAHSIDSLKVDNSVPSKLSTAFQYVFIDDQMVSAS